MKSLGLVCCWVSKLSTGVLFLQQAADDGELCLSDQYPTVELILHNPQRLQSDVGCYSSPPHCLHTVPEFLCLCVY